ncbi:Acg family FMN-binding oxidoreductase [Spirillospora albida]|uniref:Acg family FMN-binding oxidoreductase n=1 Tax=Spirillospora albida TaxID=58123 RepID=UPI0004C02DAD|nr:hypothetical protein [Spirillospora albida]
MRTDRDVFKDLHEAVADAVWAPSVYNTQPWRFGVHEARISVRADADRRLAVADPDGREMLISCGAALYNLRLALRALGHEAAVNLLPDPDRPHLLADVEVGPGETPDEYTRRLHAQIRHRRSHRGGFRPVPVQAPVLSAIRYEAEQEGARLVLAADAHVQGALAALNNAAQHIQAASPEYEEELVRWAPAPGSRRLDGVQQGAYPQRVPHTEPDFSARDFARGHGWGIGPPDPEAAYGSDSPSVGTVMLLVTDGDAPADWLRAGQALQRSLLRAAEHGLAAAYNTQALQIPDLRGFIRLHFCGNAHPQLLLRFGVPDTENLTSVRRPVEEVLTEED